MKLVNCFLCLVAVIGFTGCDSMIHNKEEKKSHEWNKKSLENTNDYVDQKIADLNEEISLKEFELEVKLLNLESKVNSEQHSTCMKFLDLQRDKVVFNLYDPGGFRRIDTDLGLPLFLAIEDVIPYLNGYKVKLNIGNPNNVTFKDVTLELDWWIALYFEKYFELDEESDEVKTLKKSKSKVHKLLTPIEKGKWNTVELVIPSMNDKDAKTFRVMLDISVIVLNN